MTKKIISILLVLLVIILWFYFIDVETVFLYFGQIKVRWVLAAILLSLLHTFLSAYKLSIFLNLIKKLSPFYIWGLLYIGAVISLLSSFPAGGFSMAYLLKTKTNVGYHKIVCILLVDYIVNILITLGIAMAGISYFIYYGKIKIPLVSIDTGFYILSGLSFIIIISKYVLTRIELNKYLFFKKLYVIYSQYKTGIMLYANKPRIIFQAIILAFINVLISGIMMVAYYKAFAAEINYLHLVFSINILSLLNTLPGLPFKLGQYELLSVITLPVLLNVDKNLIFSVAFVEHAINLSVSLLFGFTAVYFLHGELYASILSKFSHMISSKRTHLL